MEQSLHHQIALVAAVLAAFVLLTNSFGWIARAEDDVMIGVISHIDPKSREVTLTDGQIFIAGSKVNLSKRQAGERVAVTIAESDGSELLAVQIRRLPEHLQNQIDFSLEKAEQIGRPR